MLVNKNCIYSSYLINLGLRRNGVKYDKGNLFLRQINEIL